MPGDMELLHTTGSSCKLMIWICHTYNLPFVLMMNLYEIKQERDSTAKLDFSLLKDTKITYFTLMTNYTVVILKLLRDTQNNFGDKSDQTKISHKLSPFISEDICIALNRPPIYFTIQNVWYVICVCKSYFCETGFTS